MPISHTPKLQVPKTLIELGASKSSKVIPTLEETAEEKQNLSAESQNTSEIKARACKILPKMSMARNSENVSSPNPYVYLERPIPKSTLSGLGRPMMPERNVPLAIKSRTYLNSPVSSSHLTQNPYSGNIHNHPTIEKEKKKKKKKSKRNKNRSPK